MRYTIEKKEGDISSAVEKQIIEKLDFLKRDDLHPDLVICIGGDGTILRAVHKYMDKIDSVRFVGIHTGTLGFFTDYTKDEIDTFIDDIKKNQFTISKSNLLEINIFRENKETVYALNEMRIESILHTQKLDIFVDGEYFETITGSGVCICTQAGSTAMNRALKGAVVDDGIQLLQMCEITGIHHHLSHSLGNPYIMKCSRNISIESKQFKNAYLCYDHQYHNMDTIKKVTCTTSNKQVQFIRFREYSYLKRLKNLY